MGCWVFDSRVTDNKTGVQTFRRTLQHFSYIDGIAKSLELVFVRTTRVRDPERSGVPQQSTELTVSPALVALQWPLTVIKLCYTASRVANVPCDRRLRWTVLS